MPQDAISKIKNKIKEISHNPGVYIMRDSQGKPIYVGKAKNLRKRVSQYFQSSRQKFSQQPKIKIMLQHVETVEVMEVKSEAEALILEGKLIKDWRPKYNTQLLDDKKFLLIELNWQEPIPTFSLTRKKNSTASLYFGPYAYSHDLKYTLQQMKKRFGVLIEKEKAKPIQDDSYQLYADARSEISNHSNVVSIASYRDRVRLACNFLEGKSKEWMQELEQKMRQAAEEQDFENAAALRDQFFAIKNTLEPNRKFTQEHKAPKKAILTASEGLRQTLKLKELDTIECFDISHISGSYVVASMVQFQKGRPKKANYRRYRIKSFVGNDDYQAMQEVVLRRYQRLVKEERPLPDLIVIDGGLGQVHAALKALELIEGNRPLVIGLAKRKETIVFGDDKEDINLPYSSPALQLLQRIRDEAHRFANNYSDQLKRSALTQTELDACKGIGEEKKKALMQAFKTVKNIKKASLQDLSRVDGIGPKLAQLIHNTLHDKTI